MICARGAYCFFRVVPSNVRAEVLAINDRALSRHHQTAECERNVSGNVNSGQAKSDKRVPGRENVYGVGRTTSEKTDIGRRIITESYDARVYGVPKRIAVTRLKRSTFRSVWKFRVA